MKKLLSTCSISSVLLTGMWATNSLAMDEVGVRVTPTAGYLMFSETKDSLTEKKMKKKGGAFLGAEVTYKATDIFNAGVHLGYYFTPKMTTGDVEVTKTFTKASDSSDLGSLKITKVNHKPRVLTLLGVGNVEVFKFEEYDIGVKLGFGLGLARLSESINVTSKFTPSGAAEQDISGTEKVKNKNNFAYLAKLGVDFAIADNMRLGGDFVYSDFGSTKSKEVTKFNGTEIKEKIKYGGTSYKGWGLALNLKVDL